MTAKENARAGNSGDTTRKQVQPANSNPFLSAALACAADGYFVFPLIPGGKVPPAEMHFKEQSTRDPEQIKQWWADTPRANIGIYTGRYGDDAALFVVDVDVKDGKTGFASLVMLELEIDLPPTAQQRTWSGGRHIIYRVANAVKQGVDVLGHGLDIRSRGGYIVGPGSIVNGKPYQWIDGPTVPVSAPAALLSRLPKETPKTETAPVTADSSLSVQRALEYLRFEAEPAISGAGGNDQTFRVAAQLRDFGLSRDVAIGLMLSAYNEKCSPPWAHSDLSQIVGNAYRYAENSLGAASPSADFEPVRSPDSAQGATGAAVMMRDSDPVARLLSAGFSGRDAFRRALDTAKQHWLVKRIIKAGTPLSVLLGAPKAGKSLIAIDLSLCVATGTSWHGHAVSQAPVLFLHGEGAGGMATRIAAWAMRNNIDPDNVDLPRFHALPLLKLDTKDGLRATLAAIDALQAQIGENFGLIIVDTVARAMSGDENSAKDMGALVSALDALHRRTGGSVLAIHHLGKDSTRGGRGSNALLGALDLEMTATRQGDVSTLEFGTARDQEPFPAMGFKLEWQAVCLDEELEERGAPVPRLCDLTAAREELDADTTAALDALHELAAATPDGWVPAADWREAISEPEMSASTKRTRYYRAEKKLKSRRWIEIAGEQTKRRVRPIEWATMRPPQPLPPPVRLTQVATSWQVNAAGVADG